MENEYRMDPATPAAARAVITGLLIAFLSAGSLVAFSIVARQADDPIFSPVVPHHPAAVATPFVVEDTRESSSDRILGIRIEPATVSGQTAAPIVLGERVRNKERERTKDHDRNKKPRTEDATLTPHAPSHSPCDCDRTPEGHHSNGNAYRHYKDKAGGNAYGHTKAGQSKSSKKSN